MKYDELSEETKEKVLKKFHDINIDHEWWDPTIDQIKNELEDEFGLYDIEIKFSGFASQGDGASFTGKIIEFGKFLEKTKIESCIWFNRGSLNYVHENTVSCDFEDLESQIEEWRHNKCREIYHELETEYDYLTSDKAIEETLKINDYEFDEEGNLLK